VAELIGTAFELAGVAVLVIGAILSFTWYVVSLIRLRDGPASYHLVLVRTFLSWALEVEINGEWPWQRLRFHRNEPPDPNQL
jgi:hypothetical protein